MIQEKGITMKMTPLASNSAGNPGSSIVGSTTRSSERLAAAKAIAAGETPISVNTEDPQAARIQANIKKIQMRTQVSTNRDYQEPIIERVVDNKSQENDKIDLNDTVVNEETKPLSPQFAALAKQRRALQVKESDLAKREEALKATPQEGGVNLERLKSDPLGVLQEAGVTYDQLTESILNGSSGNNQELRQLREEIKALKEGFDKNLTDRDSQAEQQVRAEIKKDISRLVASGDDFEMIRETKSEQDVDDLIYRTWTKTGEILDTQEACELVETELINESLKIAKLKKVQGRLTPSQEQEVLQQQQRGQLRTLTNRDNARPLLDRRARALAAFAGVKK